MVIFTLLVLSGLYGAWWMTMARAFDAEIVNWAKARQAEGWTVNLDRRQTGGSPFTLKIKIIDPAMKYGAWSWQGKQLDLSLDLLSPEQFKVDFFGQQSGQVVINGKVEAFTLVADNMKARADFGRGMVLRTALTADGLTAHLKNRQQKYTFAELNLRVDQKARRLTEWGLRLRDLRLPETLHAPLGRRFQRLNAKGQFYGVVRGQNLNHALSAWRDGGGKLNVTALDVAYLPLQVTGGGGVTLDANLQPMGGFDLQARGGAETIDVLVNVGMIKGLQSVAAKLMLATLTKTPEGGGETYLDVSLTLQDQILSAGPYKILRLRPIIW